MGAAVEKKKKAGQITLQTIADELGLSRTTISNAYGRPDQLTPDLRDKILATAQRLGYCGPDAAARTLRRGKSGAYGLLTTETLSYIFSDPAAMLTLQGVAEVFDELEASLLALPAREDRASGIRPVQDAIVDGFLLNSLAEDDPRLPALVGRNVPVVVMDEPRQENAAFVGGDDRLSGRLATDHLLALGHRRINIVSFPLNEDNFVGFVDDQRLNCATIAVSRLRILGALDSLLAVGLDRDSICVYEAPINTIDQGERAAAHLLDRASRPTAIFAASDQLAIGVMHAARSRSLSIPGQLSVIGYDDIPAAAQTNPPLSTIRQPLREKGRIAARLLLDGWEGAAPVHILPTELIVRASTGPAPNV